MEDFFKRMDRDYDGRLSFGEFMGEETPLEKVVIVKILGSEEKHLGIYFLTFYYDFGSC